MDYIDIHCHLDFPDYEKDFGDVLGRMKEKKVGAITIGTSLEDSKKAVKIAEANEGVWACIGVHPVKETPTTFGSSPLSRGRNTGTKHREGDGFPSPDQGEGWVGFNQNEFEKLVKSPKVVGIGECGLDFFRTKPEDLEKEKERQTTLFKQQIEFALKYNKPLMLHCRAAYDETLEILEEYRCKIRGNSHFFAGTVEQAGRFVELGFTCSFTGVITFTSDYDEVIKSLPLDMIMTETDAPFVAPVPCRGKRNEPAFVGQVVKKIAEIKGVDLEMIKKVLVENASRVFGLVL